ncbi:MAG: EamA family transporter [Candidatus Altiarchaeota archaeon]|nr:EamA family transporter [Candidatus Altiarchaeota archaeon]
MTTEPWAVAIILGATVIGSFGSIYLKRGSNRLEFNLSKLLSNRDLFLGLFLFVFSSVFFIIGLRGGELSVLYPLVSAGYIWISLLSVKMLGESMNRYKWLGIVLIVLGVALIGRGS